MRVLVVDDDPALRGNIRSWLERSGMTVDVAGGVHTALGAGASRTFDVIVLDVMLGEAHDGFDVCGMLRRSGTGTPILMLTALDAVPDRVHGLEAGADDYLVKPFALEELEARIRALGRRHLANRSAVLRFGDVELDTGARTASAGGRPLSLTEKETRVLEFLLLHSGRPQPQDAIHARVWGYTDAPPSNLVDTYVGRLRRKLAVAASTVTVVARKRQGYLLDASGAPAPRVGTGVA